jgi:pimeloyl-ACP methyl ester carboxylesterase
VKAPLALFLSFCCSASATPAAAQKLPLKPCRLKGLAASALCGTLDVPEDRAHPQTRTLHIKVAVLRSLARTPRPDPLFLLAGGPGQSALESLGPLADAALGTVRRDRDLVLVDIRGTGASNPLECKLLDHEDDAPLAERMRDDLLTPERLAACLKKWDADPAQYTTPAAMQDLDEVRAALGYERINLWGGSYGTRAALVYLRDHAAHARAVVLDGVAPLQLILPLSMARDAQRALDLLFDSCQSDPACNAAFPKQRQRFAELLAELGRAPVKTTVPHPLTGVPTAVTITRDAFVGALRGQLYLPDLAALMPLTIDRALHGDWAPFVAQNAGLEGSFVKGIYLGLLFATTCAEDLPYTDATALMTAAKDSFLGPRLALEWQKVCTVFPKGKATPAFREPVRSDVPVLLLSGELDPVTPPSWAEEAKKTLSNGLAVVMPGVGHGVTPRGCAPRLIARFLEQGTTTGLDTSCVGKSTRPPFFVSFAGPTP